MDSGGEGSRKRQCQSRNGGDDVQYLSMSKCEGLTGQQTIDTMVSNALGNQLLTDQALDRLGADLKRIVTTKIRDMQHEDFCAISLRMSDI